MATTSGSNRKKKSWEIKSFLKLFLFLLLAGVVAGWFFYKNEIYFYLNRDQYQSNHKSYITVLNKIQTTVDFSESDSGLVTFISRMDSIIKEHPMDGRYYYMKGSVYFEILKKEFQKPANLNFIIMSPFHRETSLPFTRYSDLLKKSLLVLRKSMYFHLSQKEKTEIQEMLAYLYFWQGPDYSTHGRKYSYNLPDNSVIKSLYNIQVSNAYVNWELLEKNFPSDYLSIWKSTYYIHSKSYPFAFSILKEKSEKVSSTDGSTLADDANYLLYQIMKKNGNPGQMIFYMQRINMDKFLERYPEFLAEYVLNLRFYGYYSTATEILTKHEQKTLAQKQNQKETIKIE